MNMTSKFQSGTVINNKFEIKEQIAIGSVGADIYLGRHLNLERDILIKMLPATVSFDNVLVQRFLQEIKLTAALIHPNILPAFEAGEVNGHYFMVTAYEKGFYLNQYIEQRGYLEERESLKIIIDLCKALDFAWENQKVLHRNIKPESILIDQGNVPMLTDFGMAKAADSMQNLTGTGMTIGNPMYMSPEQVRADQELDFRSDMYCLGLVFYYILTSKDPFQMKSQLDLLEAQINKQPLPVHSYNDSVSEDCLVVLGRMLEKDRDNRHTNWQDLIKDLTDVYEGKSLQKAVKKAPVDQKTPAKGKKKLSVNKQKKPTSHQPAPKSSTALVACIVIFTITVVLAAVAAIMWISRS